MNRLDFFVLLAFVSQVILAVPRRQRFPRGYYYEGDPDYLTSPNKGPNIHPPWFHPGGGYKPELLKPGPFDYHEAFGGGPDRYGSDEDFGNSRSRPGGSYGSGPWLMPTTQKVPEESQYLNRPFLAICIKSCPVSTEYNPVCGSNDVTYPNLGRLECERNCGIAVTPKNMGPCSSPGLVDPEPEPPIDQGMTFCLRTCPISSEYNPVCGSDRVTYSNPGRLECAQRCGAPVTLVTMGPCSITDPVEATTSENDILVNIIATCMRSCSVTTEFNPVCGTNNITYSNPGRLECAQNCGVKVQLGRKSSCDSPLTEAEKKNEEGTVTETTVIITTSPPYVNSNGDTTTEKLNNEYENWAIINGSIENNNNQSSFDSIDTDEDGNQSSNTTNNVENPSNNYGNNTEDSNGEDTDTKARPNKGNNCNGGNRKTPSVAEIIECMQTCTLTSESNPVCGTDSITYMNPGRLLCAQFCGVDVRLKKFAPCNSTSITNVHCLTPCTNPPASDETDPGSTLESCMKACPASTEFKPVCGSNNVTYRNLERLQRARRCGIDVSFIRQAPCAAPEVKPNPTSTVQDCIQQCYIPHKYEPICGSDNVTYNNTGHLICTRQCGSDVEVKHFSACKNDTTNDTTTSTTTEEATSVTPAPNGYNITIDPSILASIWSELANTTTAVSPSKDDDDDEDFELDQRVKD